ncbi:hypothetical protein [Paenibacillus macerans]|uniref:hypothetical protein n=1 Tax=Paenibacillus macerans TaxID=44252 RepID=UPI003D31B398
MISIVILLLLLMAFSHWRDKEAFREGAAINRWVSYSLMLVSFGILVYTMISSSIIYPADWLGRALRPLVPFP